MLNQCSYPEGSDLIFYPQSTAEATPEAIADQVHKWLKPTVNPTFVKNEFSVESIEC
ncbi:bacteriocin immunity protein [Enterobacter ludwigii]|uniref:bacteriocin immunity protein n=1 Tax=Enterobacter ludwigii TaxID=299767 RepID=UPI0039760DD5